MNINRIFCVSDCKNYDCDRMLSYSVVKAHERIKRDPCQDDFSEECEDYIEPFGLGDEDR
jgi:hypothetical protein